MNHNWRETRLGEHVDLVAGFAFKSNAFTNDPADVPLVKGSTVQQGYINWAEAPRWPSDSAEEYRRFELIPGDVVLAMDRPWVEAGLKYSWIRTEDPTSLLVQRVARLRGINGLRTDFLRLVIGSPRFADYIRPIVTGVNVPHISGDQIRGYEFRLPPEHVQGVAVRVISAYDDLIENNTRRIAILEEMAQAIYREWFVNFRFPGHEQVEIVESKLGPIPNGWTVVQLGEMCRLTLGQSPKSEFYNEDGRGLPFHQGVADFGDRFPTTRVYCTVDDRTAEPGDILFSVRAPVGRINLAAEQMVIGRGLHAIRHKNDQQEFLFYQLKDRFREEDTMGGGTVFRSVTKKEMLGIDLLQPPNETVRQFEATVRPISALIYNVTTRNNRLTKTRDLLLPKLVSGEIDVATMEDQVVRAT